MTYPGDDPNPLTFPVVSLFLIKLHRLRTLRTTRSSLSPAVQEPEGAALPAHLRTSTGMSLTIFPPHSSQPSSA